VFSNLLQARGRTLPKAEIENEVKKPRVLIGVPGFAGVTPECQENFFQMAYRLGRDCPNYDFFLRIILKREQFRARNTLVDLAIVNDCDYLLMLDDDMVCPPDLFTKLSGHDKDVCGALYYQRGGAYHPVIMRQYSAKDGLKGVNFINHFDDMLRKPGLYDVTGGVIGGGCLLFKTEVFNKIQQPYFWIDGIVGTDVYICNKLADAGVKIWVDTSVELGHVGDPTTYTSRNIPQYGKKLGEVNEALWNDLRECYLLDNDQLETEIHRATRDRKDLWMSRERETWEGVRDFYQINNQQPVFNLAQYNLKYDQARDWAINDLQKVVPPGGRVADMGCGIGYVSVPLAQDGYDVTAIDIEDSPTSDFLRWRVDKHKIGLRLLLHGEAVPPDLNSPVDLVLMISVWDHLFDPIGTLDWIARNTKDTAYVLCDSWRGHPKEGEPQHINHISPGEFVKMMKKRGFHEAPENPILFKKGK